MEKKIIYESEREKHNGLWFMNDTDYLIYKRWFKVSLMFLIVIALGLFIVNQTLGYIYKVHFLKSPCDLCATLNPEVKDCVYSKTAQYWSADGWTNNFTDLYINIDEINKTNPTILFNVSSP